MSKLMPPDPERTLKIFNLFCIAMKGEKNNAILTALLQGIVTIFDNMPLEDAEGVRKQIDKNLKYYLKDRKKYESRDRKCKDGETI